MANVYVVVKKRFFNVNGTDYAGAVDYTDIRTFSNATKAEEFVQSEIEEYKKKDSPPFVMYDYAKYEFSNCDGRYKAYKIYTQEQYNHNGVRIGFMITKQEIE
jgi:hypothetical protein